MSLNKTLNKTLSNIDLQVVSKYLNFKDIENLIKINNDLKYNYHSTFEFINISTNYIIPICQIKKIINMFKLSFPNLEEIILNITSQNIRIEQFEKIKINYYNFQKYSNLNIKINFSDTTNLYFHDLKINEIEEELNHVNEIVKNFSNLYIWWPDWKYKKLIKLSNIHKNLNFIVYMHEEKEINYFIKNINKIINKNIYYTNIYYKCIYSKYPLISPFNNIYLDCKYKRLKNYNLIGSIYRFKKYYNILRLKHKINNSRFVNLFIRYEDNLNDRNIEFTYSLLKEILNDKNYKIDELYYRLWHIQYIIYNDELFYISYNYKIDECNYMYLYKEIDDYNNDNKIRITYFHNAKNLIKDIKNYWKVNNIIN